MCFCLVFGAACWMGQPILLLLCSFCLESIVIVLLLTIGILPNEDCYVCILFGCLTGYKSCSSLICAVMLSCFRDLLGTSNWMGLGMGMVLQLSG